MNSYDAVARLPGRRRAHTPWDGRVEAWDELASSPVFIQLAEQVLRLADPQEKEIVVDIGAGTGLLSLRAARIADTVFAVDYSHPMLERLAERARADGLDNIHPVAADMREIPLEDECADVIVSSYAFHHLPHAGKEVALAEGRRLLRPGGRIVVCDMMFSLSLGDRDRRIIASKVGSIARKGPAGILRLARNAGRVAAGRWEHPATPDQWRGLLEARYFTGIEIELAGNEAGIAIARRPEAGRR